MYRKQFGSKSQGSKRRPSAGSHSHFNSNKRAPKKKFGASVFCDISKFVNKAAPQAEVVPYCATNSFADFLLDERLKNNILGAGYCDPTPIQDQTIPEALAGRDVVGIANTGTGKTAAFVIPLVNKVLGDREQKVLIIAPTRELAIQINQEFIKFARGLKLFSVCTVGGMPIHRQINDLRRSHNFIIGTPGRIKDLLERGSFSLNNFQTIVLDEADRMLDMGFINDMRFLMNSMPCPRQTLFFSATLSADIKRIIREFLDNPVSVSVKTGDTALSVDQDVVYVKKEAKIDLLHTSNLWPNKTWG